MDSPWPVCVGNLLVEFGHSLSQAQREAGAPLYMHMLPVGGDFSLQNHGFAVDTKGAAMSRAGQQQPGQVW